MQAKKKKVKKFFNLESLRRKYGLTQKDMAALLGYCESNYNHKVNRVTPFSNPEMMKIHEELNKRAKRAGDEYLSLDAIFLD